MEEKVSKKLRDIDEEIATYFRACAKARWLDIEQHWKLQKAKKVELTDKLKSLLTEEELFILGINK